MNVRVKEVAQTEGPSDTSFLLFSLSDIQSTQSFVLGVWWTHKSWAAGLVSVRKNAALKESP
jgi:hypothetical protein